MICPVKCPSCGRPIAHLWAKYQERVAAGENKGKVMTELGIERVCCRAVFMGHVDLIHKIAPYK